MCGSMVDIQSPTAEIRRGKKEKRRKIETTAAKYNGLPITVGSHNKRYIVQQNTSELLPGFSQKALSRGRANHFSPKNSTNNQLTGCYFITVSSPPVDDIWAMMIVWMIREKINYQNSSPLYCVLCTTSVHIDVHTHAYEQFLETAVGLWHCRFTGNRASFVYRWIVYFGIFFDCQYQCNWLPGNTRFPTKWLLCWVWH